jgi:enoyl-CoA hydratase
MSPDTDTQTSEVVKYAVEGRTAIITIDRPQARNSISPEVAQGIEAAIDKVEADEEVWVAILTGTPPVFSAGADLKAIGEGRAAELSTERGGFAGITRRERTKPVIAAVEGAALAGGTEIVLSCDLVVAGEDSRFGIPEVKRGLVAAAGGLFRLGRKIPINVAMECTLTGDPIDAARARSFGLVNELVPSGGALDAARALAERITANAPLAVSESRRVVLAATGADDDTAWRLTGEANEVVHTSEDLKEGVAAFIEKRAPNWKGR